MVQVTSPDRASIVRRTIGRQPIVACGQIGWRQSFLHRLHFPSVSGNSVCPATVAGFTLEGNVETSTWTTKAGLAQMLKGGVIMDVVTAEQARIAEEAGACAVMALERVPADIRAARRRRAHERPRADPRDHGGGHHPGHGQGAHRPLRRGADPGSARRRLHRRERGAHPGRRGAPHRQARLQGAVRLRLPRPGRGAAPRSARARR